jgi:hypothetical protein
MQCHLLSGLVVLAMQQLVDANFLGAPGVSNATQQAPNGGNNTKASREGPLTSTITTTTSLLFPAKPGNDLVGSITPTDSAFTMKVVEEGWESVMDKFKKANDRFMKMTCTELDAERDDLDKAYDEIKEKALMASFESARLNAVKSKDIAHQKATIGHAVQTLSDEQVAQTKAARKLQDGYEHATTLHLNALEQYALKCGVKDKWCEIGDTNLNMKFDKLRNEVSSVDAIFTEAGWLRNQAVSEMATAANKKAAELRWGAAMQQAGHVWAQTAGMGYGLEVQTAACGLRPPSGPWATPPAKCNLKPSDPMMQALLRDDPAEFVRQWKEVIGKKAGLSPDKVRVDVSGCF